MARGQKLHLEMGPTWDAEYNILIPKENKAYHHRSTDHPTQATTRYEERVMNMGTPYKDNKSSRHLALSSEHS